MITSRFNKKIVIALFVMVALASVFPGTAVHAQAAPTSTTPTGPVQSPSFLSCVTNPPGGCIYYVSFLVNSFLGLFINMGAVVIKFALAINGNVFNSPTVQKGFAVTLALANLGFVIGIIVIALATILRSQTYGIKQLLWKLIVMAILVNFGLVITAPILGFADNLSSYFLTATGGSGGIGTGANGNGFVTNLTAAFQPQLLLNPPEKQQSAGAAGGCSALGSVGVVGGSALTGICNYITTAFSGDTSGQNAIFTSMLALLFSAVFETIVLITFWAIGILLIVRYVYIAILLIVLPLAWLTWIFPKFSSNFDKWWQEFIRWSFFPAITLFFIYLAFQVVSVNPGGNVTVPQAAIQAAGITGPELGVAMGTGVASILQTALDEILLCALCIGGLFAANSMGIKGAGTAMGAAKWAGGQVTGYVGKRAKQAGTAPFRSQAGRKLANRLQQTSNSKILRGTGLDWVKRRVVGRGLESIGVAGAESAQHDYSKEVGGLTKSQALNQLSSSNAMRRQEIMKRVDKEGWHDDARAQKYLDKGYEDEYKRYNNGEAFDNMRAKSGIGMLDAIKEGDEEKLIGQIKKTASKNPEALPSFFMNDKARDKKIEELKKRGVEIPVTMSDASLKSVRESVAKSFAGLSPTNASSFLNEVSKGNNLEEFKNAVSSLDPASLAKAREGFSKNEALVNWVKRGGQKTLIDLDALYKLGLPKGKQNNNDDDDDDEVSAAKAPAGFAYGETKEEEEEEKA